MHELPLVFFTVLGQTAVGMMLLAFIAGLMGQITATQQHRINFIGLILFAIGMAIGGLHMGQPQRAFNLLFGLLRSPMSNEIVLSGLYFGSALLTVALGIPRVRTWLKTRFQFTMTNTQHQWINGVAVLLGLAFAWSITQVYQLETVPAWNTHYTALHLWLTVLISGGMAALALGVYRLGSIVVMVGALLSLVTRSGYMTFLNETVPHLVQGQMIFWYIYLAGVVIALIFAGLGGLKKQQVTPLLLSGAVLVLLGELAERITFYNLWWITM
ncbi:dimethyl sulfoxide reductase anchor subunit [Vibrio sp. V27_P1S3P104]|uniref:dimethyl sulfoxide reductase anchor subunit family protein n=1 Tax=Vibrio TaxID=662 RepID=UPI000C16AF06|nr:MULTISPECIES: DmsC/YnfH family molybdoenzyme membrane anchor subunit [Vibrio]NAW69973.1 dimethyl sulfoxide reductase anchor subunit [Vibrio sp. V28_P6S34P95]NAX03706.1 dimethyl sulfoxide reductase anchor subunit [Vibrio sp. V30_P3S12P165]NAX35065.1 dimethyl sulfoxide reductase anchor subunit [Vibrio sp. V29_P1S30P107]NAX36322.1 dimethyl sulfoxide reductase anchor subunit [Vibrio sp. V27_P1S3P104]NAX41314.1 dimethyl sulfoxide reductase anchor subunit [Vibrio sp. V26_P1S5P106]